VKVETEKAKLQNILHIDHVKTVEYGDIVLQLGPENWLPRHPGQVYFHAGLVLIADHLPAWASALLR